MDLVLEVFGLLDDLTLFRLHLSHPLEGKERKFVGMMMMPV